MIKVGSDFSGVGAFNQALIRLGIKYEEVFACDMDKYARQTFIHNYGEPKYYPKDVYDREIPNESLDIYMTSPPCQAFSLAGKRLGKDDKRGILFFNSHEFIKVNKPRFFIFENVKGLLSDDGGKTFQEWVNMLGGKSVNGDSVLFPYEDSVPYHLYWKVLNAKDYGVPQNRERVFLIGIRDDKDNTFRWPIEEHLSKKLKDVLEDNIDDKYFLSEKMLENLTFEKKGSIEIGNLNKGGERGVIADQNGEMIGCLSATDYKQPKMVRVGYINQDTQSSQVYNENGISQTMSAGTHGYSMGYIQVKSATAKGYEEAGVGDSINLTAVNSETRRGRVGKEVAQTLDTGCNQGILVVKNGRSDEEKKRRKEHYQKTGKDSGSFKNKSLVLNKQEYSDTIIANPNPNKEGLIACNEEIIAGTWRTHEDGKGFRPVSDDNCPTIPARAREDGSGQPVIAYENRRLKETLKKHQLPDGEIKMIDSYNQSIHNESQTISARWNNGCNHLWNGYKIRRLTPRECFRLMDFPDTFTWPVSDSQAYKQAGNSIVVNVLYKIIKNLNLK